MATEKRLIDLTGQRFGKLVVVKYNGVKKKKSGATVGLYLCKCDCGKRVFIF